MSWEQVQSNPEYQALPENKKDRVRLDYFTKKIAPRVPPEALDAVRRDFFTKAVPPIPSPGPLDIGLEGAKSVAAGATAPLTLASKAMEFGASPEVQGAIQRHLEAASGIRIPLLAEVEEAKAALPGEIVGGASELAARAGLPEMVQTGIRTGAMAAAAPLFAVDVGVPLPKTLADIELMAATLGAGYGALRGLPKAFPILGREVSEFGRAAMRRLGLVGEAPRAAAAAPAPSPGPAAPQIPPTLPSPPVRPQLGFEPPIRGEGFQIVGPQARQIFEPRLGEMRLQVPPATPLRAIRARLGLEEPLQAVGRPPGAAGAAPRLPGEPKLTRKLTKTLLADPTTIESQANVETLVRLVRAGKVSDGQLRVFTNRLGRELDRRTRVLGPDAPETAAAREALEALGIKRRGPETPPQAPPPPATPQAAPQPAPAPVAAPGAVAASDLEAQAGRKLHEMTLGEFKAKFPQVDPEVHKEAVRQAVRKFKQVPEEVAKDYLDVMDEHQDELLQKAISEFEAQHSPTPILDLTRQLGVDREAAERFGYSGELENALGRQVFKAKGGKSVGQLAEEAYSQGLIPEKDNNVFLQALDHELRVGRALFPEMALGSQEGAGGAFGLSQAGGILPREAEAQTLLRKAAALEPRKVEALLRARVSQVGKKIEDTVKNLDSLNERAKIAVDQAAPIQETGTLAREARPEFRKGGVPVTEADLQAFRLSAVEAKRGMAEIVAAAREFERVKNLVGAHGDALSANLAGNVGDALQSAVRRLNKSVEQANVQRFVTNRIMKSYDGPIPKDVIETLRTQNFLVSGLKEVKAKLPITTNILRHLNPRNWGTFTPGERAQFWRDLVNQFRLNLFSPFSWTLDFLGNASELGAQTAGGLGHDIAWMTKEGKFRFPATQGLFYAIEKRAISPGQPLAAALEEGMGTSIGGERISGGFGGRMGTFTMRGDRLSKLYDYLIGTPLYAKGFVDAEAGRLSALAYVHRRAIMAADQAGARGAGRVDFIKKFVENIPESVVDDAVAYGQKARFNRPLGAGTERLVGHPAVQLLFDAFPRWGIQFTKWGAEMLGYNPQVLKALGTGTATPEMVGEYMAKTLTGWGGLYFIDKTLYDRVDFNSMEYVTEDGDRSRLSNREPLPSALFMLAVLKRDPDKSAAALKFASIPGAKAIGDQGGGGLLGGAFRQLQRASESRKVNPVAMADEFNDMINRMIPGQAMLGMIKTVMDPVIRKGVGAGLPGVSRRLPPVIDPATGRPLAPKQRIPGTKVEVPSVLGTPIPGATRVLDPVQKLLFRYGEPVYRGPRTSILGIPEANIPAELKDEWIAALGRYRQRFLGPLASDPRLKARVGQAGYDAARETVVELDREAAKAAGAELARKHGLKLKKLMPGPFRELSGRERAMPEVFLREALESRRKLEQRRGGE